jgi:hypothetical protein
MRPNTANSQSGILAEGGRNHRETIQSRETRRLRPRKTVWKGKSRRDPSAYLPSIRSPPEPGQCNQRGEFLGLVVAEGVDLMSPGAGHPKSD